MSLRLASPFQNHAVLQRGQTLPVWGRAAPFTSVRAALAGHEARTLSNAAGDWLLRLPALPAGGPHTLVVETQATGERLAVSDLLVGEVWLASGQSNMEWTAAQSLPRSEELIATADFPGIRVFNVERRAHLGAHREAGGRWRVVTPESAPAFSAVALSFARRLHRELGVPVGILSAAYGGTIIEAWTSRDTLSQNPGRADWLAAYEAEAWTPARWANVPAGDASAGPSCYPRDPGVTRDWHRADLDDAGWAPIDLPRTWQNAGHRHSGVFWFRRVVEIPADWVGRDLELRLGAADKHDIAFVNGVEVGRTGRHLEESHWNQPRAYPVPAALVSGRRLVLAVRVYSFAYDGGLIGPVSAMDVRRAGDPASAVPIAGPWRLRCEHDFGVVEIVRVMGHGEPNSPHMLFDNMIRPFAPYALRGAIWYQGESNDDRPDAYARLLGDLVADWRRHWGLPSLAFHAVQLTAFRIPMAHQPESRWALIREAQAALLETPGTGLAVTIDVGETGDIHPKDKVPVGERLAQSALARTYGRALAPNGPLPAAFSFGDGSARIEFTDTDGGLGTGDGAAPRPFFLAGADRVFHPAGARIEGASVAVSSPDVPVPVAVRYAWADNPEGCNLVGASGLPASPFRSDRW